jgi:D-alanyl-D-alanine carboxypeptidase/D-alanyl-D-alanine-endopeptidase (penicillin-binding protein 4)
VYAGDALYRTNHEQLLVPASNDKIFSIAAAMALLGTDHRYETPFCLEGPSGPSPSLCVSGRADSSLTSVQLAAAVESIANSLAEPTRGIRVVLDDSAFSGFPASWEWADLVVPI